jgi:hypothetical protein
MNVLQQIANHRNEIADQINKGFTDDSPLDDQIEKAEGSRGGKVIGHTKSGKPIYDSFGHPKHDDFNSVDHKEAGDLHRGKEGKGKQVEEHHENGTKHYEAQIHNEYLEGKIKTSKNSNSKLIPTKEQKEAYKNKWSADKSKLQNYTDRHKEMMKEHPELDETRNNKKMIGKTHTDENGEKYTITHHNGLSGDKESMVMKHKETGKSYHISQKPNGSGHSDSNVEEVKDPKKFKF